MVAEVKKMAEICCPKCDYVFNDESPEYVENSEGKLTSITCPECGDKFIAEAIGLPAGYTAEIVGQDLLIKKVWYEHARFILHALAGVMSFLLALVVILLMVFSQKESPDIIAGLTALCFFVSGLFIGRRALAIRYNVTDITVNSAFLDVHTHPFPLLRRQTISSDSIKQIFCKEIKKHVKHGYYFVYKMQVVINYGEVITLDEFKNSDEPKRLERLIETYLGIENLSVVGEHTGFDSQGTSSPVLS